ncbi:MAG: hypothetical protein ABWX66_01260 [Lacisediminihabitans sp.]
MDTSGDSTLSIVLFFVLLALFAQVAVRLLRATDAPRRFPGLAVALGLAVGIPSLLQFAVPAFGDALRRDPRLTVQDGQWWRILTAVAAQDGGLIGAIFTLVVLVAVVAVAQWIWGWRMALLLFLVPSIVLNLLAVFAWNTAGGGSSFATDGLLASLCGLALVTLRDTVGRLCAALVVVIGVVLVATNDAHGVAILLGAAFGALFALSRARAPRSPRSS